MSTLLVHNEQQLLTQLSQLLTDEYELLLSFNSQLADEQAMALERIASDKINVLQLLTPLSEKTQHYLSSHPKGANLPLSVELVFELHEKCERQNYTNGELLASYQERIEWSLQTLSHMNGTPLESSMVYNKHGSTGSHTSSGLDHYS